MIRSPFQLLRGSNDPRATVAFLGALCASPWLDWNSLTREKLNERGVRGTGTRVVDTSVAPICFGWMPEGGRWANVSRQRAGFVFDRIYRSDRIELESLQISDPEPPVDPVSLAL